MSFTTNKQDFPEALMISMIQFWAAFKQADEVNKPMKIP